MPWTLDCLTLRLLHSRQIMGGSRTGLENVPPGQVNSSYPARYGNLVANSLISWFYPLSYTTGRQQFIRQDHMLCRIDCLQLGHKLCKAILNESLGSIQLRHLFPSPRQADSSLGSFSNMLHHSHIYYVVHVFLKNSSIFLLKIRVKLPLITEILILSIWEARQWIILPPFYSWWRWCYGTMLTLLHFWPAA